MQSAKLKVHKTEPVTPKEEKNTHVSEAASRHTASKPESVPA